MSNVGEKIACLVRLLSRILGQEDLKGDCLENEMNKRKKKRKKGERERKMVTKSQYFIRV